MFINNLLSIVEITTLGELTNEVRLDWLGEIIKSLIEGSGSIGLGIIIFTLILKTLTLPFDIFSRVSTKKNSVRMEKMRPELEKLQRQYANNKEIYQAKMQELYKKNGYSPFAACLPTLLNLCFFIVVIGQFSTYSNYANFNVFCKMSVAYEQAIENFNYTDGAEDGYIVFVGEGAEERRFFNLNYFYDNDEYIRNLGIKKTASTENPYEANFYFNTVGSDQIEILAQEIEKCGLSSYEVGENGHIIFDEATQTYSFNKARFTDLSSDAEISEIIVKDVVDAYAEKYISDNIREAGREAAATAFRSEDLGFLWVKNIWSQDLPWEHPVKDKFASYGFVKSAGCAATCRSTCNKENNSITSVSEAQFGELTANLSQEKDTANGYLILVILSIGTMLLSQIVMQKANKAQTELSTVDGENGTAAQSQKMMTWMMPVMFGFFSFMYTASFSIYIIVNSVFGLLSTMIINWLVDRKFKILAEKEARELELKRTGRIKEIINDDGKKKK